ncbi:hypothetical protein, variant [Capsaspora owczarzaki ATCC 30864]|uniref:Uncharacterized protein n=1 Tax=Capsaspora owczarzaki (strain ATCC 30864) TaxID=595528 RepID=A0A0D2UJQ9_CAPO3|nr:hypothetical protein, variant [Capsaspora owczarzaki ATCC 30864]
MSSKPNSQMDLPASAADPKPNARTASAASFDDVDASQSTKRARANNQQVVDNASHGASQQLTAMKNAQRSLTAVTQGQANVAMPNSGLNQAAQSNEEKTERTLQQKLEQAWAKAPGALF